MPKSTRGKEEDDPVPDLQLRPISSTAPFFSFMKIEKRAGHNKSAEMSQEEEKCKEGDENHHAHLTHIKDRKSD